MSGEASVTHWIHEVKAGTEGEAQHRIWERYFERLVALARTKLEGIRAYEDEEEVALSAMKSFFQQASRGRFPQLSDRTGLWPLLVKITVRKAANVWRRQLAACRDVRRTVSLQGIVGEEPTPEFAEQVFDQTNQLLSSLDDESLRQVARLKLEGYSNSEIGEEINRSVKTVERKLALIRQQLTEGAGE